MRHVILPFRAAKIMHFSQIVIICAYFFHPFVLFLSCIYWEHRFSGHFFLLFRCLESMSFLGAKIMQIESKSNKLV